MQTEIWLRKRYLDQELGNFKLSRGERPLICGWHRTPLRFFLSTPAYEATDSAASLSNSKCYVMSLTSPEPLSPPLPIIHATV